MRTKNTADEIIKELINKESTEINSSSLIREKNCGIFEGKAVGSISKIAQVRQFVLLIYLFIEV